MHIGVIGIGDMGSGLAKNLIANGFQVTGYDLLEHRMQAFADMGGNVAADVSEVGRASDAVFIMVMNGDQVHEIVFGDGGLTSTMAEGSTILLTATIKPREAREIGADLEGTGLRLIDSPVSGGFPGGSGVGR